MCFDAAHRLGIGAFALTAWCCQAQWIPGFGASRPGVRGGFQLYDIGTSTTYLSTRLPGYTSSPGVFAPGGGLFGSDYFTTISTSVGWSKPSRTSHFSAVYTPSYMASASHSDWNTWNHAFVLNFGRPRRLSSRWKFDFSVDASVNSFQQLLFTSSLYSQVVATPSTFSDFSSVFTRNGDSTNDQLNTVMAGAPQVASQVRAMLFGDRALTASGRATFSYVRSRRFMMDFDVSGVRAQHLSNPRLTSGQDINYVVPYVNSAQASVQFSYSLRPHTRIGVTAGTGRSFTQNQDAYANTVEATLSQTMGRRWFASLQAGTGFIVPVRTAYHLPTHPQFTGAATLGFKTRSQTFVINASRAVGDMYGFGAYASTVIDGAWQYSRPGRNWWLYADYGQTIFKSLQFAAANGWMAGAGYGRTIARAVQMDIGYSALAFDTYFGQRYRFSVQAIHLSLVWSPHSDLRRREPPNPGRSGF